MPCAVNQSDSNWWIFTGIERSIQLTQARKLRQSIKPIKGKLCTNSWKKDPGFESSHRHLLLNNHFMFLEKTKIKRPWMSNIKTTLEGFETNKIKLIYKEMRPKRRAFFEAGNDIQLGHKLKRTYALGKLFPMGLQNTQHAVNIKIENLSR